MAVAIRLRLCGQPRGTRSGRRGVSGIEGLQDNVWLPLFIWKL